MTSTLVIRSLLTRAASSYGVDAAALTAPVRRSSATHCPGHSRNASSRLTCCALGAMCRTYPLVLRSIDPNPSALKTRAANVMTVILTQRGCIRADRAKWPCYYGLSPPAERASVWKLPREEPHRPVSGPGTGAPTTASPARRGEFRRTPRRPPGESGAPSHAAGRAASRPSPVAHALFGALVGELPGQAGEGPGVGAQRRSCASARPPHRHSQRRRRGVPT